jgi:hypothetical protein
MTPRQVVDLYYDAWITKHADLSAVPLVANFRFRGPVGDFDDADGYRAMARQAGAMVTAFTVRHQFVDGNRARMSPASARGVQDVDEGECVGVIREPSVHPCELFELLGPLRGPPPLPIQR